MKATRQLARVAPSPPQSVVGSSERLLVVGLDGREPDADALALAVGVKQALGGLIVLAHVLPSPPAGRGMAECEALDRAGGRKLLARAASELGEDVEKCLLGPGSAAAGLSALARERGASLLVLASSHRGPIGRIVPGGVASRLLSRAPCAIAVAPVRYADGLSLPIERIGVAYDATEEADLALAVAANAAARLRAPLRLYHVMHSIPTDPAWDRFRDSMTEFAQGILEKNIARLPPDVEVTTVLLEGDIADKLARAAAADGVGLLYVGSRGYGPLREALLGGVSGALLHTAQTPLVIVPHHPPATASGHLRQATPGARRLSES